MQSNYNTKENTMMKRISKINQLKATKQDEQEIMKDLYNAERQAQAAKMDWHLRKLTEAREAGNQFNVDWHDAEIAGCELRLHQLKKFV